MKKQFLWIFFVLVLGVMTLYYVSNALVALNRYYRLSAHIPLSIESWEIQEPREGSYGVFGSYSYEFRGKTYRGTGRVGAYYPNIWAAQKKLTQFASQSWSLWVDPSKPERASLERVFPMKKTISALILVAISIYFFLLGFFYQGKLHEKK